jgi:N12 class adenine-specific DNA methylase
MALQERKAGGKTKRTRSASQDSRNAMVKAQEMLDRETDDVATSMIGYDGLVIDEAHEYKQLGFATAMQRGVKGVDPSYSKKSQGVYLKTQACWRTRTASMWCLHWYAYQQHRSRDMDVHALSMPADTMREYGINLFRRLCAQLRQYPQMLEFSTNGKYKENNALQVM